jgi:hypothetical protein
MRIAEWVVGFWDERYGGFFFSFGAGFGSFSGFLDGCAGAERESGSG